MSSHVLIPIANDVEDIETVTMIDVLRRANIQVTVASIAPEGQTTIRAARGTTITADTHYDAIANNTFDCIALPGGLPGAEHLRDYTPLIELLKAHQAAQKWIAAICASPAVVFAHHNLLDKIKATCYPALQDKLPDNSRTNEAVVVDGKCITSQGPATAMAFALKIVDCLAGEQSAKTVADALLF